MADQVQRQDEPIQAREQDEIAVEDLEVREDTATEVKGGTITLNFGHIQPSYSPQ